MARLFADENFPLPAVEALRRLGHNVLTIHEAGKAQQSTPDHIVLNMASADGRAILTLKMQAFRATACQTAFACRHRRLHI